MSEKTRRPVILNIEAPADLAKSKRVAAGMLKNTFGLKQIRAIDGMHHLVQRRPRRNSSYLA